MRKMLIALVSLLAFSAQAKNIDIPKPYFSPQLEQKQSVTRPGVCEIEVRNNSIRSAFIDVVYPITENKLELKANMRIAPGYTMYIPLFYGGFCHTGAYALMYNSNATILYKNFAYKDQVLTIENGLSDTIAVKSIKK